MYYILLLRINKSSQTHNAKTKKSQKLTTVQLRASQAIKWLQTLWYKNNVWRVKQGQTVVASMPTIDEMPIDIWFTHSDLTAMVPSLHRCNVNNNVVTPWQLMEPKCLQFEQINTLLIEGFKYGSSLSLFVKKLIRRQPSQVSQFSSQDITW